jgi:hypothetical protein
MPVWVIQDGHRPPPDFAFSQKGGNCPDTCGQASP